MADTAQESAQADRPRPVEALGTPFVLIDGGVVEANLRRAAAYAAKHGIGLRPHTKTHKMVGLARRQMELGAVGLTVAKPSEARVMTETADDLLLAYPVVAADKAAMLADLAKRRTIRVAVDGPLSVTRLSEAAAAAGTTIGVLIDFDLGYGRTGVGSPDAAVELALAADRAPGLRVDGLMIYPGHIWDAAADQLQPLQRCDGLVAELLDRWREHGLSAAIVSSGSTPTLYQSHHMPSVTEIRPGTYVFNDMNTVCGGYCQLRDCAATVVTTVVSDAVSDRVILDAGSKTLTSDRLVSGDGHGHGHILECPDAIIDKFSEEHGHVDVSRCSRCPVVGQRVRIVPNHICPCINLHDVVWWTDDGRTARPVRIDARGCVQ